MHMTPFLNSLHHLTMPLREGKQTHKSEVKNYDF